MMKVSERKLVVKVALKGKRFRVSEDALIDTGAAFTVIPPELADFLELDVDRGYPSARAVNAKNLQVVIHKIPDPAPVKILLGMSFIERINLEINGKDSLFEIRDP